MKDHLFLLNHKDLFNNNVKKVIYSKLAVRLLAAFFFEDGMIDREKRATDRGR